MTMSHLQHPRVLVMHLRPLSLLLFAIGAMAPPTFGADPRDSVVRVTAELRLPNPLRPWARQNPVTSSGSGVVLEGQKILTNAHLLLYATDVWIQARAGADRYAATVETLGTDVDLAVLSLEDPSFFDDHPVLPEADGLPEASSEVVVYGFPIGGNGLSITRGVISRVTYAGSFSDIEGLVLQVDAAINAGNSGGPALVDDRMVGVVTGSLSRGENIGYIIPNREIDQFLADAADGRYRGKPRIDLTVQGIENPALREKLGIGPSTRGGMIVHAGRPGAESPLRPFDVLTHIGPYPIDDEGMVRAEPDLRLPFVSLISGLERDGSVPVTVLREGRELERSLPTHFGDDSLIPSYSGEYPPYFVCGPLVFSPARQEAVEIYYRLRPELYLLDSPLATRAGDQVRFEGEELVVITAPMLPHRITRGYSEPFGQVVQSVNGVAIRNLRHLVETLRDIKDPYLVFRFAEDPSELLVFRRQEFFDATQEVMLDSGIPRRGSEDLLTLWEKRTGGAK